MNHTPCWADKLVRLLYAAHAQYRGHRTPNVKESTEGAAA